MDDKIIKIADELTFIFTEEIAEACCPAEYIRAIERTGHILAFYGGPPQDSFVQLCQDRRKRD